MNYICDVINKALLKIDKKDILDNSNVHIIKNIGEWKNTLDTWKRDKSKCEYNFFENNELFILDYECVISIERYKNMSLDQYKKSIVISTLRKILMNINEDSEIRDDMKWFYEELAISLAYENSSEKNIVNSNLEKNDLYRMCYISSRTLYKKICDYIVNKYDKDLIIKYLKNNNALLNDMDNIIAEIKNNIKNNYNIYPINIENENIIVYSKKNLDYANKISEYVEEKFSDSDKYFEIKDKKIEIFIMNKTDFKEFIEVLKMQSHDWLCGVASNCICAVLTYEEYINYENRKNQTFEDYLDMIVHEVIHARHQLSGKSKKRKEANWFKEALACNLGNPKRKKIITIENTLEDIRNSNNINYNVYYTIGKYMLDNYSLERIKEYIIDDDKVVNDLENVLNDVNNNN